MTDEQWEKIEELFQVLYDNDFGDWKWARETIDQVLGLGSDK